MSYDLYFWRQTAPTDLAAEDLLAVLERENGHPAVAGFERDDVAAAFLQSFPAVEIGDLQLMWEGEGSYFEVHYGFGPHNRVFYIAVNCGYELVKNSPDTMNTIIDVGNRLGCGLYDPQVNTRFDQP